MLIKWEDILNYAHGHVDEGEVKIFSHTCWF